MMFRTVRVFCLVCAGAVAAAAATGCGSSNPAQPSSGLTASIAAPRSLTPPNGMQLRFADQPVRLVVQNATVTGSATGAVTYTFEVATDAGFANKVQTKDGVTEGAGGQTSVNLETLSGGGDYYWHVRAQGGGTTGTFAPAFKFSLGAQVVLSPPTPVAPASGSPTSTRPTFIVTNSARQGPAGSISYKFEVADNSAFNPIAVTGTVPEGQANQTTYTPSQDLSSNKTYYWRVTAIDAGNGVTSSPTTAQSFSTHQATQAEAIAQQLGLVLWPGAQPPGSPGHATMGDDPFFGRGWQPQTLYYAPQNVTFQSPDIEMLRIFDVLDHGMDPVSAINWMNANGYFTQALWYPPPEKAVIGLHYVYLAARGKPDPAINAIWDVVLRVE